jgi:hypothetical protein
MSYNPPTENQIKIRAMAESKNDEARTHFSEQARLKRKVELRRKLIRSIKIGIPILIVVLGVVWWMYLR